MKKIKSILFGMLAASILTIGFISCDNNDCEVATEVVDSNKVHLANMIQEKLMIIINDTTGEYKDGGYIVYSAEDNEMLLLSDFTYTLGDIFYRFTQGETCDKNSNSHQSADRSAAIAGHFCQPFLVYTKCNMPYFTSVSHTLSFTSSGKVTTFL